MGRPSKQLYERDGIYYYRHNGKRWSTETGNQFEAMRRSQFMRARNMPWSELKEEYSTKLVLTFDPADGSIHSNLSQYYPDMEELGKDIKKMADAEIAPKFDEFEPPKDCKDLEVLLNYEYRIKNTENKPAKTLEYYRDRYDALLRFVKRHELKLDTFTSALAFLYPKERLNETMGRPGQLGFNNRPASGATVNKEISLFKSLWGVWKDENRVAENVWARVQSVKVETGDLSELEPEPYTLEQVAMILKEITDARIQNVLLFQCMIGARPGLEVLGITPEAINKNQIWSVKKRRWDQMEYSAKAREFYHKNLNAQSA